jgi:hypothetical protein
MWCITVWHIVTLILSLLVVPLAAEAQPARKVLRIGFLMFGVSYVEAFRQGLRELGYVEGLTLRETEVAARGLGMQLHSLEVRTPTEVVSHTST